MELEFLTSAIICEYAGGENLAENGTVIVTNSYVEESEFLTIDSYWSTDYEFIECKGNP